MVNKAYRYPNFELWEGKGFQPKAYELQPLIQAISEENAASAFLEARTKETLHGYSMEQSTERSAIYSGAVTSPEVRQYFQDRKLHMVIWRQNELSYMIVIPEEHMGKKGYQDDMDTLFTNASCDYGDPYYAMYAFEQKKAIFDRAARERSAVVMILSTKGSGLGGYVGIYGRTTCCFHLNYHRFFLDVSPLIRSGKKLKEVKGFLYNKGDPDEMIQELDGIPFLDISGSWSRIGGFRPWKPGLDDVGFDQEAQIYSETGRKSAEALSLCAKFADYQDPRLYRHFADMGVELSYHDYDGENWAAFVPTGAREDGELLPVMGCFGETGLFNGPGIISIFRDFYPWIELAAQGQCIVVIFAMESADDNDRLMPIMEEAARLYRGDPSRFYVTGFSHNGNYVQEFGRRHGLKLAGVAPFGDAPGQEKNISDEQLAVEETRDLPMVMIAGMNEVYGIFPMHSDAPIGGRELVKQFENVEERVISWQKRLKSNRCPVRTAEEILATKESADVVERKLGIPCDKSDVLFLDGFEQYIADIKNIDGKYHLRIIGQENTCHQIIASKCTLSWSFLRRFARDLETGEIIERY